MDKKQMKAWHLPWTADTVPHGVLDISRGCNISCRSCYNFLPDSFKSLDEVSSDLETFLKFRRIHSLSIAGGEVTLHPDIFKIVRLLKSKGIPVEIFTNGLLLDAEFLKKLKDAGTNLIVLHIQTSQKRPDLPENPSIEDCRKLIEEKVRLISSFGMESGLSFTAYGDNLGELEHFIRIFQDNPEMCYMLITLHRDITELPGICGNIMSGLKADVIQKNNSGVTISALPIMQKLMKNSLNLDPFAFIGSNKDKNDVRWLSYLTASLHLHSGRSLNRSCRVSLVEKLYMASYFRIKGRYPFYNTQNPLLFKLQLFLNAFAGGFSHGIMGFLFRSLTSGAKLIAKRILFQCLAEIGADGTVTHCENCPDATVKNGQLVPLCIADRITKTDNPT